MASQEKKSVNVFAAALLVLLVALGISVLNNPNSITGYQFYEEEEGGSLDCEDYFGDNICDDSSSDCGQYYKAGTSLETCNECQTIKNGKPGFDKCVVAEVNKTIPCGYNQCNADTEYCYSGTCFKKGDRKSVV